MNPVTFNDYFKPAVISVESPKVRQELLASPLFDYPFNCDRVESIKKEVQEIPDRKPLFPFKCFRIALKPETFLPQSVPEGYFDYKLLTYHIIVIADNCYYFRCPDAPFDRSRIYYLEWDDNVENVAWYNPRTDQWVKIDDKQRVGAFRQAVLRGLLSFSYDVMTPSNHIAEIKPSDEHRSVEWVKARTHYTLISHGHPANRKDLKEHAEVKEDKKGELTRMAHNRRAHFRTLKSPYFRFARGQRVLVKAAWIGPKEWRDQGGRQIYRILNEPGDLSANAA